MQLIAILSRIGVRYEKKCPALCPLEIESRNIELDIMCLFIQLFLVRRHHHRRLMEYRRWEPDG